MWKKVILVMSIAAMAAPAWASWDCSHSAKRSGTMNADGVSVVRVEAGAGSLVIKGTDSKMVAARGDACASSESILAGIDIEITRSGNEIRVKAKMPDSGFHIGYYEAKLDLAVEVPRSVKLVVHDGSGETTISGVAAADVDDGSGALEVRDITGDVKIEDGSGELRVQNVGGNVTLSDGSGGIEIAGVGSVHITEDGSGSIEIRKVVRDVRIDDDGSGSIDVADVGGDFTVGNAGSGGVHSSNVRGRVRVP
ncbi:MAG: hypothetical protein WBX15_10000 [Thermoanaerobaculia bacterium]